MQLSPSACYTLLVLILGKHSADCNVCSNSFRIADYALLGHVLKTVRSQTFEGCLFTYERDPRCFSVNFYAVRASCEMNLGTREDFETDFMPTRGSSYISMVFRQFDPCVTFKACRNGGHCEPYPVTRCVCLDGFSGSLCEVSVPVPLGLESGSIKDKDISASSSRPGYEAYNARLNGLSCWRPLSDDTQHYLTIATQSIVNLTGIATQGASYEACWVTQYSLQYYDGLSWTQYQVDGNKIDFDGNKDQSSVEKHEMQPFRAIVLRLYPSAWHQCIALRMELYGKRLRSK